MSTTDPNPNRFNSDLICSLREALRPEATDSDFRDFVSHLMAVLTDHGLVEVEDIQNLQHEISSLEERLSSLEGEDLHDRLSTAEQRIEDLDGFSEGHDLQDFDDRIQALESEDLDDRISSLEGEDNDYTQLASQIERLEERVKLLSAEVAEKLDAAPARRWWQIWN